YQGSFRYEIPLPSLGKYQHETSLGLDFKSSENFLALNVGTNLLSGNTPTEIFQLAFGYTGILRDNWGATTLGGQLYYSPGDFSEKNSLKFFTNAVLFAKPDYVYGRLQARRVTAL